MASFLSLSLPKLNLIKASSTANTSIATLPTAESLNEKFGRKGIKFLESDNIPIVEMTVRDGSSLSLRIPDAHVTSYKPKVYWKDDGYQEVLYTIPATETGLYKAKGGVGLVMNEVLQPGAKGLLPPTLEWTVNDVDSDAIDALQVELSCTSKFFDITYIVTLYPVSMATAVIIKNKAPKPVTLNNAILSHFRSKKRGGTGIKGLRSCSFCSHPPLSSPFQILTPSEAMIYEPRRWCSFGAEPDVKPGTWTQQGLSLTLLENKMSRVYAVPPDQRSKAFFHSTPSKYETIDQGREIFFRVIRMGFEDIYVCSPGSLYEKYGKDYFICTGPASLLVPVTVNPGEEWRGAQVIEHDNLT
ncbi:photosynthetic NDH subunit of subcomplex B 2, chloroplastic [Abrus precatorius]|uniref:Photosynthetic NDH subunit of subcomplex B 2, chloroplastic n=1 Tax=Abrus precatorius TaxID=3816 RepID=A0A8B8L727_ABRPR|nr:photosynthetic NDH subunit of subcomplex B 2, chloroplastic [Abrus precatorius]